MHRLAFLLGGFALRIFAVILGIDICPEGGVAGVAAVAIAFVCR